MLPREFCNTHSVYTANWNDGENSLLVGSKEPHNISIEQQTQPRKSLRNSILILRVFQKFTKSVSFHKFLANLSLFYQLERVEEFGFAVTESKDILISQRT